MSLSCCSPARTPSGPGSSVTAWDTHREGAFPAQAAPTGRPRPLQAVLCSVSISGSALAVVRFLPLAHIVTLLGTAPIINSPSCTTFGFPRKAPSLVFRLRAILSDGVNPARTMANSKSLGRRIKTGQASVILTLI